MKFAKLYWDITEQPCEFPSIVRDLYFKESIKNRANYTKWIGKISKKNQKKLDWWLTSPPSRNPFISTIHKHISVLNVIEKIKDKVQELEIRTDSEGLIKILTKWSINKKIKFKFVVKNRKKNNK